MRGVILYFVLAICLCAHAAEGNIPFSVLGANRKTYKQFINQLRGQLTVGTVEVYNIPVLKHEVPDNQRFILIDLTNYNNQSITVAVDVYNVYVVGYLTDTTSYFFDDAPAIANNTLFPGTTHTELPYGGSYIDLQRAAGESRVNISLGLSPLSNAISSLFFYDAAAAPGSFLVIIQMISEAARFRYIEGRVLSSIGAEFDPDRAMLSLENHWGILSDQIQEAQEHGGQFPHPVHLVNVAGHLVKVTNVSSPVVRGIALLQYHNVGSNASTEDYIDGVPLHLAGPGDYAI